MIKFRKISRIHDYIVSDTSTLSNAQQDFTENCDVLSLAALKVCKLASMIGT